MPKTYTRTRRSVLVCPMKCTKCGEEIKMGETYKSSGGSYTWHEKCYNKE